MNSFFFLITIGCCFTGEECLHSQKVSHIIIHSKHFSIHYNQLLLTKYWTNDVKSAARCRLLNRWPRNPGDEVCHFGETWMKKFERTRRQTDLEWPKSPAQSLHTPSTSHNNPRTSQSCRQSISKFRLIYSNVRNNFSRDTRRALWIHYSFSSVFSLYHQAVPSSCPSCTGP